MKTKDQTQTVYAVFQTDNYYIMDGCNIPMLVGICKTKSAAVREIVNQKRRIGLKAIVKSQIKFRVQAWKVLD